MMPADLLEKRQAGDAIILRGAEKPVRLPERVDFGGAAKVERHIKSRELMRGVIAARKAKR